MIPFIYVLHILQMKFAIIQKYVYYLFADMPLHKPIIIQFTDEYICQNIINVHLLHDEVSDKFYNQIGFFKIMPGLTHWGRVTHVCVDNLTSIGPDNGLSPGRRQAIIWTNAGILFIGPLGTNFSEILIGIHTFSFKKMHLKISSAKWRPFCLGLNVLKWDPTNW